MSPLGDESALVFRAWRKLSFVWKYQIVFWTIYTIVSFPVHFIGLRYVLRWEAPLHGVVLLKLVELVMVIIITTGFAKVMETPWFRRQRPWRKTGTICLIIAGIILVWYFVVAPLTLTPIYRHYGMFPVGQAGRAGKVIAAHTFHVLLYGGWAGTFLLVRASSEGKRREKELLVSELKRKESEILMLRSQMNPHFLFNAMSTIAYESGGNEKIDHLVEGISDYLRYSLSTKTYVPLHEEIEATRRYLDVQAIRLGTALEFEIDVDPASHQVPVPGIFLQTLVENALKYGGRGMPPPLRIRIVSRCHDGDLRVEVANTGNWVTPSPRTSGKPGGLGLENLKTRLALFYPDRFEFGIRSEDGWTTVSIVLRQPETPSIDRN